MGRVALALARKVKRGIPARFIVTTTKALFGEVKSARLAAERLSASHPLVMTENGSRRQISAGVFYCSDVQDDSRFLALLAVGPAAVDDILSPPIVRRLNEFEISFLAARS